ncbi:unnamed protein product, partial [Iphiclides podalirius]
MDSKPKADNIKSKRSNRKFTANADSFICKEKAKTAQRKLSVKRRGLYVERNPAKLEIDEVFFKTPSSMSSQRDNSSSILTTSIVGNRKSFTHEVIKTRRRVRRARPVGKLAGTIMEKSKVDLPKGEQRSKSKASKEDTKDDVVYVLQSRSDKGGLAPSDSFRSKRSSDFYDSTVSLKYKRDEGVRMGNIPSGSFESGIDRIAAEVLQGWMSRKEKEEAKLSGNLESPTCVDKTDGYLYNLSLDLAATAGSIAGNLREFPSCSKAVKPIDTVPDSGVRKITFDLSEHSDLSEPRFNVSRKFHITESNARKFDEVSVRKRRRGDKVRPVPKTNRSSPQTRSSSSTDKGTRRNTKKEFLDIIRRELEMCEEEAEAPRNMFDALKVVARNKQLTRSWPRADPSDTDCDLQSPKLIRTVKRYSNRLKSKSANCPADTKAKTRWHKRMLWSP